MSRRDEIKEGLYQLARDDKMTCIYGEFIEDVLTYLHSQGVVIKVDRELPEPVLIVSIAPLSWSAGYDVGQRNMIEAGYTAVESLI